MIYDSNNHKGYLGESTVKHFLTSKGYEIESHNVEDKGLDIKCYLRGKLVCVCEVINWYGGIVHTKRFKSIIDSLLGANVSERIFFIFGSNLTSEQIQILNNLGIKYYILPTVTEKNGNEILDLLNKKLSEKSSTTFDSGKCVITSYSLSLILSSLFLLIYYFSCLRVKFYSFEVPLNGFIETRDLLLELKSEKYRRKLGLQELCDFFKGHLHFFSCLKNG